MTDTDEITSTRERVREEKRKKRILAEKNSGRCLKHKGTGMVYVYTPELEALGGYELVPCPKAKPDTKTPADIAAETPMVPIGDVRSLQEELARLRNEVQDLRALGLTPPPAPATPAAPAAPASDVPSVSDEEINAAIETTLAAAPAPAELTPAQKAAATRKKNAAKKKQEEANWGFKA